MSCTFFAYLISVAGASFPASSKSFGDYRDRFKTHTNISINKHEWSVFYILKQILKKVIHGCSFEAHLSVMEMETMNTRVQERMCRGVLKVCIKYLVSWQRKWITLTKFQRWLLYLGLWYWMPSVIWFVDVEFLPRTVLPFYMYFCQTNTDWIFSEHHLLIFLVVQLFSHRPGCISAHWYTCGIYPSTYNINFTQVVAKCLRIWIQRLSMTFIKV